MPEESGRIFQAEVEHAVSMMYQNKQQEAYQWVADHMNELKDALIAAISHGTSVEGENAATREREAVSILEKIVRAYQQGHILDMADCLQYQVIPFCRQGRAES